MAQPESNPIGGGSTAGAALRRIVALHSVAWLVVANAVGALLAVLLLWPEANDALAPLTYGRWVPLHLNWQLYGWSALPLVGVMAKFFLTEEARAVRALRWGLGLWSAALLYGGVTWLCGETSGKIFLDWTGSARWAWSAALAGLWAILWWESRRRPGLPRVARFALAAMVAVPAVLFWSAGNAVYPPVNPHSGGATGASLLGSTLVVVVIFGVLPWLLRLAPRQNRSGARRAYSYALAISFSLFAGIGHGHASHHRWDQIVGLGSLLVWIPLVWFYARSFAWAAESARWLGAAFAWWLALTVTGWLMFLPGVSERTKFTNALVAHSHLAMAGMVTSWHVAILLNLGRGAAPRAWSFWVWQTACTVHVIALLWLGWQEGAEPALLYVRGGVVDWTYGLRLATGVAMLIASFDWLLTFRRNLHEPLQT